MAATPSTRLEPDARRRCSTTAATRSSPASGASTADPARSRASAPQRSASRAPASSRSPSTRAARLLRHARARPSAAARRLAQRAGERVPRPALPAADRPRVAALEPRGVGAHALRALVVVRASRSCCCRLVPGRDGLVLAWRGRRATFLPKVWEQVADAQRLPRAPEAQGRLGRRNSGRPTSRSGATRPRSWPSRPGRTGLDRPRRVSESAAAGPTKRAEQRTGDRGQGSVQRCAAVDRVAAAPALSPVPCPLSPVPCPLSPVPCPLPPCLPSPTASSSATCSPTR